MFRYPFSPEGNELFGYIDVLRPVHKLHNGRALSLGEKTVMTYDHAANKLEVFDNFLFCLE